MNFNELEHEIKKRAKQYSKNSISHKCFIEEASGFDEGVKWTLNKLYQLGYLDIIFKIEVVDYSVVDQENGEIKQ